MDEIAMYMAGLVSGHCGGQVEATIESMVDNQYALGYRVNLRLDPNNELHHKALDRLWELADGWQHNEVLAEWARTFTHDNKLWLIGDGDDTKASVENDDGSVTVWVRTFHSRS
jgi:hypothetical protein